jgi:hypothetical protein
MSKKTFNGWKNRETWVVALWIDNTEADQAHWTEAARTQLGRGASRDRANDALARQLENEITDSNPLFDSNVHADLLNCALANVDWYEIAANLIEGLK